MNDNHIVRIPPHNKSAEQSVIGSMILDENRIDEVADILSRDDFYVPAYGAVFSRHFCAYSAFVSARTAS